MSLRAVAFGVPTSGFPRVSGDEPRVVPSKLTMRVFSPRERG